MWRSTKKEKGETAAAGRPPLGDATGRVNTMTAQTAYTVIKQHNQTGPHPSLKQQAAAGVNAASNAGGFTSKQKNGLRRHGQPTTAAPRSQQQHQQNHHQKQRPPQNTTTATTTHPAIPARQAISNNILAQTTTPVSGRSKEGYKQLVGPWILGKTLGKGSNGQVRLCRHRQTGQDAAVKIIGKRAAARFSRETSMAALCTWDSSRPNGEERRVPVAIEREVAILKLVDHPNILKLYDMWENRSDIYVVLELVEGGDLWHYIAKYHPLPEEHVLFFYRQIISAVSYCHDFNICHRDLKPENILLTAAGQIKICDFGMAALHQTEDHVLSTFCGSTNYAAPELLSHTVYRGDRADVWSLGVILFIMLTTSLPFDDPDQAVTIERAKRADYAFPTMPGNGSVSSEGRSLVDRILVVDPAARITIAQMWHHPLLVRYDYLDQLGGRNAGQPAGLRRRTELRNAPVPRGASDAQLLRQLRSMFHRFSDEQLEARLASPKPNDQKVFYWLLHGYREKQLENFSPDIVHSMSDYHHLRPGPWRKRVSTCSFAVGPDRQSVSRFTVFSHVPENEAEAGEDLERIKSEAGTVQSYDPFRASRTPLQPRPSQISNAKYVIHGRRQEAEYVARVNQARRGYSSSINSSGYGPYPNSSAAYHYSYNGSAMSGSTGRSGGRQGRGQGHDQGPRAPSQRTTTTWNTINTSKLRSSSGGCSTASVGRSSRFGSAGRQGTGALRQHGGAAMRRRGLMDFTHMRQQSLELERRRAAAVDAASMRPTIGSSGPASTAGDDVQSLCPPKARTGRTTTTTAPAAAAALAMAGGNKQTTTVSAVKRPAAVTLNVLKPKDPHHAIKEEIRHFSSEVAKDLDKAFGASLITEDSFTFLEGSVTMSTPAETTTTTGTVQKETNANGADSSGLSFSLASAFDTPPPEQQDQNSKHPWDSRPLPALPDVDDEQGGLGMRFSLPKQKKNKKVKAKVAKGAPPPKDRRVVSAPAGPSRAGGVSTLPAINEAGPAQAQNPNPNWVSHGVGKNDNALKQQQQNQQQQHHEDGQDPRSRVASAPANYTGDYFSHVTGETIRVVNSPSRGLLQMRKNAQEAPSSTTATPSTEPPTAAQHQDSTSTEDVVMADAPPLADDAAPAEDTPPTRATSTSAPKKRVSFWFKPKRSSKSDSQHDGSGSCPRTDSGSTGSGTGSVSASGSGGVKKKATAFGGLMFWRHSDSESGQDESNRMTIADGDFDNTVSSIADSDTLISTTSSHPPSNLFTTNRHRRPQTRHGAHDRDGRVSAAGWYDDDTQDHNSSSSSSHEPRTIAVQQNWLARLFRVKPATGHLCMCLSRRRARREIARLLRDWRNHGMRDVEVDKERNLIFARVGVVNSLDLKEVSFAAEVMTVVEHGNPAPLSIVRLTQERGAASSFAKVVDTMRIVLAARSMLVADKHKAKMMVKTLNS